MGAVRFLLALSVAGLLFWSGVAKLFDPLKLALAIRAFQLGIPDEIAHWSAFAVPWAELVAGVCILLPKTRMAAAWLTAFLMGVFMAGIVSLLVRGMDVDCPCFGSFSFLCDGPLGVCHLLRNALIAGAGLFAAKSDRA